jgi:hypothetical protein
MSFKDMVSSDVRNVFLKADELAEPTDVIYGGVTYKDIPVSLQKLSQTGRSQNASDHSQGLYLVTAKAFIALSDMNGVIPEKSTRIKFGSGGVYTSYYVAASSCPVGMISLELEAIDE